jgi:hypothetical protein
VSAVEPVFPGHRSWQPRRVRALPEASDSRRWRSEHG